MSSDFLPSFASWAAISLVAETSPNCSTRTPGWAAWTAATAASGCSTSCSTCSSVPGISKFTTTERPSLETVLTRAAGSSGLSISVMPSIRAEAAHDVLHGGGHLRIVGPGGALALHEHLLAGLVGEARGLDDHVAALGLAAALRRLVDLVQADPAADDGGEHDEQDPAEDGRLAVLRAPSTGACCEVAGLASDLSSFKGGGEDWAAASQCAAPRSWGQTGVPRWKRRRVRGRCPHGHRCATSLREWRVAASVAPEREVGGDHRVVPPIPVQVEQVVLHAHHAAPVGGAERPGVRAGHFARDPCRCPPAIPPSGSVVSAS